MKGVQCAAVCLFLAAVLFSLVVAPSVVEAEAQSTTVVAVDPTPLWIKDVNSTFTVSVTVTDAVEINSYSIKLWYNTTLLNAISADLPSDHFFHVYNDLMGAGMFGLSANEIEEAYNATHGYVYLSGFVVGMARNPAPKRSGSGVLFNVTFNATTWGGPSPLHLEAYLSQGGAYRSGAYPPPFSLVVVDGAIVVMTTLPPPSAVAVSVGNSTENSLKVAWTQSTDPFFAKYQLFQSTTQEQVGTWIANVTDAATLNQTVTGLSPGTTYYFTVRTMNTEGGYTDSTQSGTTAATPLSQQPWVLGVTAAVIIVVIAVAAFMLKRRK